MPDMSKPELTGPFSVCVYCGSRLGAKPGYQALARRLGAAIGGRGWQLVMAAAAPG